MTAGAVDGAQVVARACRLLGLVGERGTSGRGIADLVAASGLKRPTIHRLLSALQAAGFVEQDDVNRLWRLGPEIHMLGTLASPHYSIEALARDCLERIAAETGDSAFLSVRRGGEAVCLIREEGAFPIRTHVLQAGDRLPLGVGSAGIAMLACLPDEQASAMISASQDNMVRGQPAAAPGIIRDLVAQARRAGYAVNRGMLLPGSWGIAVAILDKAGLPTAALSVTAIEQRLQPERQVKIGALLKAEADRLRRRLLANQLEPDTQRIAS